MRPLKLTKKLCAFGHGRAGLYVMPGYVSNGHWLISRDLLDATSAALLDAPDAVILAALGYRAKAGYPSATIHRATDNDMAERVMPRDAGLRCMATGIFQNVRGNCASYVASTFGAFVVGIAEDYLPVLDAERAGGDLLMYTQGMVSDASKIAFVMPCALTPPEWVKLTEPHTLRDKGQFHEAVRQQDEHDKAREERTLATA